MKKTKKLMAFFLAFSALFSSACQNGSGNGNETSNNTESITTTQEGDDKMDNKGGVFLNIDGNTVCFPFYEEVLKKETITDDDMYLFVDQYADTQITDIAYNISGQISCTPTEYLTYAAEMYTRTEVDGVAVDYSYLKPIYDITQKYGDPYETWIKRTWEKGMTPWISVRPNDCHDPDNLYSWVHGDLFRKAVKNGWTIGGSSYFRYCLDYEVPEVREIMLNYVKEQLFRYDVGGLELDFSREWYCFKLNGEDHTPIMNQFMRDVNKVVEEAEAKWGHDIKITVRLMRDIEQNKAYGFDAAVFASEKLVDSITVCPRWGSNDSDMPISDWKAAFPEIEIYAGLTDLTYVKATTYQMMAGYSAQYLSQGADKIYLYNFMNNPYAKNTGYAKMYETCGSLETLVGEGRRFVVTYQDMVPDGYTAWNPFSANADGFELDIETGPIDADEEMWVIVGVNDEIKKRETLKVYVNGVEATLKSATGFGSPYNAAAVKTYRFSLPAGSCGDNIVQTVELVNEDGTVIVSYMEFTASIKT